MISCSFNTRFPWARMAHTSTDGVHSMKYRNRISFVLLMMAVTQVHATINVFACEPEWAALAEELGGDKLTIYSATTSM